MVAEGYAQVCAQVLVCLDARAVAVAQAGVIPLVQKAVQTVAQRVAAGVRMVAFLDAHIPAAPDVQPVQ